MAVHCGALIVGAASPALTQEQYCSAHYADPIPRTVGMIPP